MNASYARAMSRLQRLGHRPLGLKHHQFTTRQFGVFATAKLVAAEDDDDEFLSLDLAALAVDYIQKPPSKKYGPSVETTINSSLI